MDFSLASLPPWLVPAIILHVAQVIVLMPPAWRACVRTGTSGAWTLLLLIPALGLFGFAFPLGLRILPRAGKSGVWAVLSVLPLVNVVFLWLFAYARWSRDADMRTRSRDARTREGRGPKAPERPRTEPPRAEPTLSAGSAAVADATEPAPPPLARPGAHGYDSVKADGPSFSEEVDSAPAVGERKTGAARDDETMIAGAGAPHPERPPDDKSGEGRSGETPETPETREASAPAAPSSGPTSEPTSDEMTLAAGVLDDLAAAESQQEPSASPLGDESRTVPVKRAGALRVWTLRGVNARSANIEVTVREADIAQSAAGILVGRSNRADFIIGDESVSRNHARMIFKDGALCVEDLDSMNGTLVDDKQLESNRPVPVADQSEIEFGKIRLLVTESRSG